MFYWSVDLSKSLFSRTIKIALRFYSLMGCFKAINLGANSCRLIWFFNYKWTRTSSFLRVLRPKWNFFSDWIAYWTFKISNFRRCSVLLTFFFNLLLLMVMCFLLVLSFINTLFCFYFWVPLYFSNLTFSWSSLIFFIFFDLESTIC